MSSVNPLNSLAAYSQFVADLLTRSNIIGSTLTVWSTSPFTGLAEGEVEFEGGYKLRMREELDFDAALITSYGYEVYHHGAKIFWYDDFPHPNDPTLAATFPHHKHVPPDIKRRRVPAPGISFERPNLPALIEEIEALIRQKG